MRRLERSRVPLTVWAAIGVGGLILALFLGFFGTGPVGSKPDQLKAIFRSESQIKPRAQVRIAGVPVGEVASVKDADGDTAEVTMTLEDTAPTIYSDATVAIKSRLVFEGNFYIDLDPGSPGAEELGDGDTVGVDRTTGPVQIDRVLSDLPTDTRNNLRTLVQGLGQTLTSTEGGQSTAQVVNQALENAPHAFRGLSQVFSGLQGQEEGDLSGLVQGSEQTFSGFASDQDALANLVTNFNRTMAAMASRQDELSRSVELLDPVLHNAEAAFAEVERALPDTTLLARELTPGVEELPGTIVAMTPWVGETTALLGRREAGALLKYLKPTVRNSAKVVDKLVPILGNLDRIARCWTENILPTGEVVINDPPQPSGPTAEQEFFQTFTGLASATQNFDGNGHYARSTVAGGAFPIKTANLPGFGISHANAVLPPLGTRPAFTNSLPPVNFDADCHSNPRPDLNSARTGGTP